MPVACLECSVERHSPCSASGSRWSTRAWPSRYILHAHGFLARQCQCLESSWVNCACCRRSLKHVCWQTGSSCCLDGLPKPARLRRPGTLALEVKSQPNSISAAVGITALLSIEDLFCLSSVGL